MTLRVLLTVLFAILAAQSASVAGLPVLFALEAVECFVPLGHRGCSTLSVRLLQNTCPAIIVAP